MGMELAKYQKSKDIRCAGGFEAVVRVDKHIGFREKIRALGLKNPNKGDVPLEDATLMYLGARIFFPNSILETPERIKETIIAEELGIEHEHINPDLFYRMLDYFTDDVQEAIIKEVNGRILNRFMWNLQDIQETYRKEVVNGLSEELSQSVLADIDTTIIHSEGRECELVKRCYNAANPSQRYGSKLVLTHIRSIKIPMFFPLVEGNKADVKQLRPTVESLERLYPNVRFTFVGDRSMFDAEVLDDVAKKHDIIIGGKLNSRIKRIWKEREDELEWKVISTKEVSVGCKKREYKIYSAKTEIDFEGYKGPMYAHFFYDEERAERERKEEMEKEVAERILREKIEQMLLSEKGRRKITKKLVRQIEEELGDIAEKYRIDIRLMVEKVANGEKEAEDKQGWYGKFLVHTSNRNLSSKTVLEKYRGRAEVEEGIKTLKSALRIRPVYIWNAARVKAYIFLVVMAYLFLSVIRFCMDEKEQKMLPQRFVEKRLNITGEIVRKNGKLIFESDGINDLRAILQRIDSKFAAPPSSAGVTARSL